MSKKQDFNYMLDMRKLCTPAFVYFLISIIGMFLLGVQNLNGNDNTLCIGSYKCSIANKGIVFLIHALYIMFWTFVLDLFCKAGYSDLSWFIVLIPIILSFVFIGMIVYQSQF